MADTAENPRPGLPRPVETGKSPPAARLVSIPGEYQAIRSRDPRLAREWREASGRAFAACFDAGLVARTFGANTYCFGGPEEPVLPEPPP